VLSFGLFLNYTRTRPEEDSVGLFDEFLEMAIVAEELGFETIWVPEHHLIHNAQAPSCLLNAVHIGQHVKLRIGTAICPLPYRHPLIWAGEIAQADHMLQGRLDVGVARGAYQYEFERLGLDFSASKEMFEEQLEALVAQWSADEAVGHQGRHWSWDPSFVWPRTFQSPHPPMWVGGQSDRTVRWAAAQGYHVFNAPFLNPMSHTRELVAAFRDARPEGPTSLAGGVPRFGSLRMAWVSDDEDDVRDKVHLAKLRQRMVHHLQFYTQFANPRAYVAPLPHEGEPTDEEIEANLLFGSSAVVLDKIREYDRAGVDDLLIQFTFGASHEEVLASMRLFAANVLEPFRAEKAAGGAAVAAVAAAGR
jgi:alkanesulfonate monooxygenase SsuD/methylene tetrahydromethanopterin reductase-like flavin-dependent oxidoreductase (luciferase family)